MKDNIKNIFNMTYGDVFISNFPGKKVYWKVDKWEAVALHGYKSIRYAVTKCNKNGKTFKESNWFTFAFKDEAYLKQHYFHVGNFKEASQVSQDGLKEGARKRRIQYLKESIAYMQKELEKLENASN